MISWHFSFIFWAIISFFEIVENYMKIRISLWLHKAFCPIVICLCQKLFLFLSQEVPETPKNFVMVSHSSRQANLSWGLPYDGQSPLLAFHLEFQRPVGKFLMSYAPSRGCTITFFFFLIQIPFNSFQNLNSYVRNYFNELKNY